MKQFKKRPISQTFKRGNEWDPCALIWGRMYETHYSAPTVIHTQIIKCLRPTKGTVSQDFDHHFPWFQVIWAPYSYAAEKIMLLLVATYDFIIFFYIFLIINANVQSYKLLKPPHQSLVYWENQLHQALLHASSAKVTQIFSHVKSQWHKRTVPYRPQSLSCIDHKPVWTF